MNLTTFAARLSRVSYETSLSLSRLAWLVGWLVRVESGVKRASGQKESRPSPRCCQVRTTNTEGEHKKRGVKKQGARKPSPFVRQVSFQEYGKNFQAKQSSSTMDDGGCPVRPVQVQKSVHLCSESVAQHKGRLVNTPRKKQQVRTYDPLTPGQKRDCDTKPVLCCPG